MQVDSFSNQQSVVVPVTVKPGIARSLSGTQAPAQPGMFDTSGAGSTQQPGSGSAGAGQSQNPPPPPGENVGTTWKFDDKGNPVLVGYFPVPKPQPGDSHVDTQWDVFKRGFRDGATHPGQTVGKIVDRVKGDRSGRGEKAGKKVDAVLEKLPVVSDALQITRGLAGEKNPDGTPVLPEPNLQPDAEDHVKPGATGRPSGNDASGKPSMKESGPPAGPPGASASARKGTDNTPAPSAQPSAASSAGGAHFDVPEQYARKPNGNLDTDPHSRGVFRDDRGQAYISTGDRTYPVRYDKGNDTWRVYKPDDPAKFQYPVRPDKKGNWQVHSDVGLKGGMHEPEAANIHQTVTIGDETGTVQLNTGRLPIPTHTDPRFVDMAVGTPLYRSASDVFVMPQGVIAGPQRGWCAGCVFEAFSRKANGSASSLHDAAQQMHDEYLAGGQRREALQSSLARKQAMGGWYDLSREPSNYTRYPGNSITTPDARSLVTDLRQGFAFPNDARARALDAHGVELASHPDNQRRFVMVALDMKRQQMSRMGPPGQETMIPTAGHAIGIERAFRTLNYRDDTYRIYEPNVGVFTYRNFDQMAYALQSYYNTSTTWGHGNEYVHWKTSYYGERPSVSAPARANHPGSLLETTIANQGKPLSAADAQRVAFVTQTSNVGQFRTLKNFAHDGDAGINDSLRANYSRSKETKRLLDEFSQLHDYQGVSYRVSQLTPDAMKALQFGRGKTFFDDGIQMSSVALTSAEIWSKHRQHDQPERNQVIMVFDSTVPQKNISTTQSPGTVAVGPAEPLVLLQFLKDRNRWFAVFGAAPSSEGAMTNIRDGKVVHRANV